MDNNMYIAAASFYDSLFTSPFVGVEPQWEWHLLREKDGRPLLRLALCFKVNGGNTPVYVCADRSWEDAMFGLLDKMSRDQATLRKHWRVSLTNAQREALRMTGILHGSRITVVGAGEEGVTLEAAWPNGESVRACGSDGKALSRLAEEALSSRIEVPKVTIKNSERFIQNWRTAEGCLGDDWMHGNCLLRFGGEHPVSMRYELACPGENSRFMVHMRHPGTRKSVAAETFEEALEKFVGLL